MAGRLQCVACVIPWKMVFRNTGVGTQLRPVSPDTSLFERRLPGRLRTVEEVPTARGTRRAVGAYLHTQPMPWVAARAFSGAWPSRRVPVRAVRCRARSVTKATELLGGWRLLAILSMHACSCECALERLPVRTVRHTVASHDMQHIDLCEPDNMLADNVALEQLLPRMINWQILSASAENGYIWVSARRRIKKDIIVITIMRIIITNGATRVVQCRPAWVCAHTVMRLNGTVRTDTRGSRSRMTCACVCARARACVESYVRACAVTV